MMLSMKNEPFPDMPAPITSPNPRDWMTSKMVASMLKCDRRTVDRLIERGVLTGHQPWHAIDEKPPTILWRPQVIAVLEAREKAARALAAANAPAAAR